MYLDKKIKRMIIASVIAGGIFNLQLTNLSFTIPNSTFLISNVAHAEIKTYVGVGKAMFDFGENDETIVNTVKAYAKSRAEQNAKEQAGVYLQTYSRSINGKLANEEISAITNNIVEVTNIQYKKLPYEAYNASHQSYGEIGIMYEATVTVRIDTDGINRYLSRDEQGRYNLVNQNNELQQSINANDNEFENLRNRSASATNDAERNAIKSELNNVDRALLAIQTLEEGNRLYYQGNYNEAIIKYNEVINLNADYAEAYRYRGSAYAFLNDRERAMADYNKAIALNPNDAWAYSLRALNYMRMEDYKNAVDDFTKAMQLNPIDKIYSSLNLVGRGMSYNALNISKRAIIDFNNAIKLRPEYATAYYYRARAYYSLKEYSRAAGDFTKAIELKSTDADYYRERGVTYLELQMYDEALADFNKAIELKPSDNTSYFYRGAAYHYLKQYDKAIIDYTKAIEINSNFARAYHNRGLCYEKLGDNTRAQADFAKARALGYTG